LSGERKKYANAFQSLIPLQHLSHHPATSGLLVALVISLFTMPKAVRIHEVGGTEVLKLEEVDLPTKGAAEVLIKTRSIGVVSGRAATPQPSGTLLPHLSIGRGCNAIEWHAAWSPQKQGCMVLSQTAWLRCSETRA
jgi:hypothetical protein